MGEGPKHIKSIITHQQEGHDGPVMLTWAS